MNLFPETFLADHTLDLEPEAITPHAIADLLDRAGIDHAAPQDDWIYAFGLGYPVWIRVDGQSRAIVFATHAEALADVDEPDGLRLANHCNETLMLVQFAWNVAGRLSGHYSLPYAGGLASAQLLCCANRFAAIFAKAVMQGIAAGLLTFPGAEPAPPALLN